MPGEIDPDTGEENQTGEIISHYNKIPQDIDILLTHDNPFKNELLSNAPRPKLAHLYGHWHDGRDLREVGYYNCSLLDDNYNVKKNFKPVIIDIMKEQEKINFLDSLSLLIEPFYKLKGEKPLSLEEIKEFFNVQKEFYKMQLEDTTAEDEIPWDTNLEIEEENEQSNN